MAIWQVDFELVPRQRLADQLGQIPDWLDATVAQSCPWWQGVTLPPNYVELLATRLPRVVSWYEDLEVWGDYDSDTIQIFRKGLSEVDCILARLDVRRLDDHCFDDLGVITLSRFASLTSCLLLADDGKLLEPTAAIILAAIRQSKAIRFLTNPHKFLKKLDLPDDFT